MTDTPIKKNRTDISLRIWSEDIPLESIIKQLKVVVSHLHVTGQPMAEQGCLAKRIVQRHYASLTALDDELDGDVSARCRLIMREIGKNKILIDFLETQQIKATLWITVLGGEPSPMPNIEADIVNAAANFNLSLFLENYTNLNRAVPEKLWLLKQPSEQEDEIL